MICTKTDKRLSFDLPSSCVYGGPMRQTNSSTFRLFRSGYDTILSLSSKLCSVLKVRDPMGKSSITEQA